MEVTVKELTKLYKERKNEDDILVIKGLRFVPGYLKYVLEYAKMRKAEVLDMQLTPEAIAENLDEKGGITC